ncbi:V-type proton ATPase subunit F isoform X2 [Drosophila tropicalis]|uniref:V-type proton ATPase subunit F isoform X2 n=1 Tax=Drosophila tropicalis TaxID=46794 RepID=UPI0035ABA9FF
MCAQASGADPKHPKHPPHHGPHHGPQHGPHQGPRRSKSNNSTDSDGNSSDSSYYSNEVQVDVEDPNIIRVGIIADSEVVLGFLLAGIGYRREKFRNYLMVENDMPLEDIENFFHVLYSRHNIGVILLDYFTARRLHHLLENCNQMLPVIVIIPTKTSLLPYLEEKDRLRRQQQREAYQ